MTNAGKPSVAIIVSTFPPYRGGMGRVAQLDAEQLAEAGYDVHVYTPDADPSVAEGRYKVHRLPGIRIGRSAFAPALFSIARRHALVILHYPFFGGAEFVALSRRTDGMKLLVTYHMDAVGRGISAFFFRLYAWLLMPWVVRSADRIIVTSMEYAKASDIGDLAKKAPERFIAIPPSVDTEHFVPGQRDTVFCATHGIDTSKMTILFTGGLDAAHYFKGLSNLLRAVADPEFEGSQLIVIGDGNLRDAYEAEAAGLGIGERVRFMGGVDDVTLAQLLLCADVFAFPSVDRSEAFGIAALEALSCGIPVVASDLPGVNTIVQHGKTGLVAPPGDVEALRDRLRTVLRNPEQRAMFRENASAFVREHYSHTVRSMRLLNEVAKLL